MTNPKPWRPYGDYTDHLPEKKVWTLDEVLDHFGFSREELRAIEDSDDLVELPPDWVESVLGMAMVAIALIILLVVGWLYLAAPLPTVSR